MEQKRTLWIIAAVGVFLLVVIGAALILSSPVQSQDPSIASLQVQNDTWSLPITTPTAGLEDKTVLSTTTPVAVDGTQTIPLQQVGTQGIVPGGNVSGNTVPGTATVEEMTVIAETTNVYGTPTTIEVNSMKHNALSQNTAVTPVNQAGKDAVSSVSNIAAATTPTTAVTNTNPVASSTESSASKASSSTVYTKSSSSTTKATTSTTTTTKKAEPVVTRIPDQYWVQVASLTNKTNAEAARAALAENKIESEIFTYTDSKGKVFYRLRVGPYSTKTEAEYWCHRITLIEEFADSQSYVTNSSAKKS